MDVEVISQLIATNGIPTIGLIALAIYVKNIDEVTREENKRRELESRDREDILILKIQTVNDTNKELACMSERLTKTNQEIARTNTLLAEDMKGELCNIDSKLDEIIKGG